MTPRKYFKLFNEFVELKKTGRKGGRNSSEPTDADGLP